MEVFVNTMGVVGAFVLGVMALTLYFKALGWLGGRVGCKDEGPLGVRVRGVLDVKTRVKVHMANGTVFEEVRLMGHLASRNVGKGGDFVPYGLGSLFILEHPDGRRTLIREKDVKMIEVPAQPSKGT